MKTDKPKDDTPPMSLDELARRMLSMPPQPKVKPKPAKQADKKPTK
jgi:hypothetical protein